MALEYSEEKERNRVEGEKDKCKITGDKVQRNPGTLVVVRKDRNNYRVNNIEIMEPKLPQY